MCQPKSTTGLRCSTHGRERLNKAIESGSPERIATAKHEYELTKAGITELRAQGNEFAADLRQAERDALVRNSKKREAKSAMFAKQDKETMDALRGWNGHADPSDSWTPTSPVQIAANSSHPQSLENGWKIRDVETNFLDGKFSIEVIYDYEWELYGKENETRKAKLESLIAESNFTEEPTYAEARELTDRAMKELKADVLDAEFNNESVVPQGEHRKGIITSIAKSSGISEDKLSRIATFSTWVDVQDSINEEEFINKWHEMKQYA